jgi:hypothetical protein
MEEGVETMERQQIRDKFSYKRYERLTSERDDYKVSSDKYVYGGRFHEREKMAFFARGLLYFFIFKRASFPLPRMTLLREKVSSTSG